MIEYLKGNLFRIGIFILISLIAYKFVAWVMDILLNRLKIKIKQIVERKRKKKK